MGGGGGRGGEGVVKELGEGEVRVAGDRKAIQVSLPLSSLPPPCGCEQTDRHWTTSHSCSHST